MAIDIGGHVEGLDVIFGGYDEGIDKSYTGNSVHFFSDEYKIDILVRTFLGVYDEVRINDDFWGPLEDFARNILNEIGEPLETLSKLYRDNMAPRIVGYDFFGLDNSSNFSHRIYECCTGEIEFPVMRGLESIKRADRKFLNETGIELSSLAQYVYRDDEERFYVGATSGNDVFSRANEIYRNSGKILPLEGAPFIASEEIGDAGSSPLSRLDDDVPF